jgi:choline dehydrogenase-like flavoprotein
VLELEASIAPAAPTVPVRPSTPAPPATAGWSARQRSTLTAVVSRMLDGAPLADARLAAVVSEVERRASRLAPHQQQELRQVLDLLDRRLVALASIGRPVPFVRATAAAQTRWLTAWSASPVPALRSAFQAFRRLALGVHYSDAAVTAAIGHAGPLHRRAPEVAWEGPLPNDSTASPDGPVAIGDTDLRRTIAPAAPPAGVVRGADGSGDVHRTADVVVIGTGAGGAVAAERLARAGFEVVLLEDGALHQAADFCETEATLAEQLYADGAMRATDDLAVQLLQGRAVGGSTTINWMIMLRTPDFVLDEWQRAHGVSGFEAATMAPVFDRVEREVHARLVSDDAHSPNNRVILDGARALGWRARAAVINAKGCVRSGFCGIGCRYDAKQGTLLTYVPRALAAGATLYADARADRIEVLERDGGRGTAPRKRVHATVRHGTRTHALTIDAPLVVVAAGAVGSPVLLQRSGLGGGAVGQYLRLHPTTATIGIFDQEIVGSAGIPLSTMCDEHGQWNGTPYGFWLECPPFLPSLGAVAAPGFGHAHAARMSQFRHLSSVIALTRDGAETRTSSGGVQLTRDGRVSIRYALTSPDAARVRASIEAAAQLQLAAGAREVHTLHTTPIVVRRPSELSQIRQASVRANRVGLFSAHVNGTCRMGGDARTAATSPEGERYGARGVYVCDGALLPTAPGVNPQETIMALATLVSERLAARYGRTVPLHGEPA